MGASRPDRLSARSGWRWQDPALPRFVIEREASSSRPRLRRHRETVKGENGASNPTQLRRTACESADDATHRPRNAFDPPRHRPSGSTQRLPAWRRRVNIEAGWAQPARISRPSSFTGRRTTSRVGDFFSLRMSRAQLGEQRRFVGTASSLSFEPSFALRQAGPDWRRSRRNGSSACPCRGCGRPDGRDRSGPGPQGLWWLRRPRGRPRASAISARSTPATMDRLAWLGGSPSRSGSGRGSAAREGRRAVDARCHCLSRGFAQLFA